MKLHCWFILLAMFLGTACQPDYPQKELLSWEEKKAEIIDSLTACQTLQDSIICLNRFAYRDAIHGSGAVHIDKIDTANNAWKWPAEKFYHYFLKDSLTVYCGGNGNFNSALYREFMGHQVIPHGFSIGISGTVIGHYINLLMVKGDQPSYYLVDPMFNTVYTDVEGRLVDLRKMIYWAREGQIEEFQLNNRIENTQYLVDYTWLTFDDNGNYNMDYSYYFIKSNNDQINYVLKCPRTLEDYLDDGFASTYHKIAKHHGADTLTFSHPGDFKYCVLFYKDIYGIRAKQIKQDLAKYMHDDLNKVKRYIKDMNFKKKK